MHDRNLSRWIVERAELTPDDYVVEIGPGLGALTEGLLAAAGRVFAIEIDPELCEYLQRHFANQQNLDRANIEKYAQDIEALYPSS